MSTILLVALVFSSQSPPSAAGSEAAASAVAKIHRGLQDAWAEWRDDQSIWVAYTVSTTVVTGRATENSGPLEQWKYWRTKVAKKGAKRYWWHSQSPPSVPPERDAKQSLRIFDGRRSWAFSFPAAIVDEGPAALPFVQLDAGLTFTGMPQEDLYGDVIGVGTPPAQRGRTLRGEVPHPFRIDEALRSGSYAVAAEGVSALGVACTLLERPRLDRIWLDPSRGYAIVQREWHWDIGRPIRCRIQNREFREVLRGLWLPNASRVEFYAPRGAPAEPRVVADLAVNQLELNISDDIFVPKLKPGTTVGDSIRNIVWAWPESPAGVEQILASAARYEISRKPLAAPRHSSATGWLFGTGVLALVLTIGVIAALWHRRRSYARSNS